MSEVISTEFGRFLGVVSTEWIDDGRHMKLLADFSYVDPDGATWDAPKDWVVDGASIPRPLWSVVGSPFTGQYRNASVVHDVACDRRVASWQAVHRMFYCAMRCGGIGEVQAKIMYAAVYRFGPRWQPTEGGDRSIEEVTRISYVEHGWNDVEFEALRRLIVDANPSLDELERAVR